MTFIDVIVNSASLPVITTVIFTLFIIYSYMQKFRNVPPGPWGIPLIGYWPFLKSDTGHLQMQALRDKYGEIFSISITGRLFIFLSSMKMLKEAHLSKAECFGERFSDFSVLTYSFPEGLAMANGESWKVQRKFFYQKFKEYGLLAVKENFSSTIYDSLNETVDNIRVLEGKPLVLANLLTSKCSCVIRRILFNDQGITEQEIKELNEEYINVIAAMTYKNMFLMGNTAKYVMTPFMPSFRAMKRSHNRIVSILKDIINRHKVAFDGTQEMDLIDSFYKEKKDREFKGDPSAVYFTDEALVSSIYQFLTDGVLSVAYFIVLFLQSAVQHPEEQEKICEELIEVVGPERQPTMEDKNKLPYTNAFINETIRFSNFFAAFPSLQCTKETTLNGYRIPKGAISVINISAIHTDKDIYKDPFTFNPSRFTSTTGKQKADLPIMFGIGKRACLGEPFTMILTFLFLTTIIKNFRLSGENEGMLSILEGGDLKLYAKPRS